MERRESRHSQKAFSPSLCRSCFSSQNPHVLRSSVSQEGPLCKSPFPHSTWGRSVPSSFPRRLPHPCYGFLKRHYGKMNSHKPIYNNLALLLKVGDSSRGANLTAGDRPVGRLQSGLLLTQGGDSLPCRRKHHVRPWNTGPGLGPGSPVTGRGFSQVMLISSSFSFLFSTVGQ